MMLSILLLILASHLSTCLTPIREYAVRRDFIVGVKAPEFTVYDQSGKNRQYRIESKFWGLHKIEMVAYPSKQVVARLNNKVTFLLYEATFEILDSETQQWISGNISQSLKFLNHKSTIHWNGRRLLMEHSIGSLTTRFLDDQEALKLVGEYKVSLVSTLWATRYTLKIYDGTLPDAIFIFGLAVRDYIITKRNEKSSRKSNIYDPINAINSF